MSKSITKIVITGGPCSGKTTALSRIEQELTEKGYKTIIVPETATMLINSGILPSSLRVVDFQSTIFDIQIAHERIWDQAIDGLEDEKIVIIYDRGIMDNKAYFFKKDFEQILEERHANEVAIRDSYDAVIHMRTAADGALKFYTIENNNARKETPEEARIIDQKTLEAWTGHPHLRIIDNSTDFKGKMNRLMKEIYNILGVPVPVEMEKKYLINKPDMADIHFKTKCIQIEIIQTYLCSKKNEERRIRQRGINGNYMYYYTIKTKISEFKRVEKEKKISKDEYLSLLMEVDTKMKPIRKTRYCFMFNNQYFELDTYPEWKDKAILELELTDENAVVDIPKFISVIKDVTEDKEYKNYSLAKKGFN